MKHEYTPQGGVCPSKLTFELDGNLVKNVKFEGGCVGNLSAIGTLVDGMTVEKVAEMLKGNLCDYPENTSCADQLALAVLEAYEEEQAAK